MSADEAFRLPSGRAVLDVDDLAVAQSEHLVALLAAAVSAEPVGGADDLLVADESKSRLGDDRALGPLADLESQDLTGLVRSVSGRCPFPPQMPMRHATPLAFVGDQRSEGFGVALVESFRCGVQLVDHAPIMPAAVRGVDNASRIVSPRARASRCHR